MREIKRLFILLCNVLSVEHSTEIVSSSLVEVNDLVKGKIELQLENEGKFEPDTDTKENPTTYRCKSPFGRHFDTLRKNNCTDHVIHKGNRSNPCYSLEVLEYLLTYYMPIVPLWTGIILSRSNENLCKASKANAEIWFRIVKHPILETKVNLRASDFIRTMYEYVNDRIDAFNFRFHPLATNISKSRKGN
ncbi:hypothetical protein LOD99_14611 [Oopsacas minuta]|uniref:Uncharacterized protein n=1 Tax=Oopsacas minuta TaxID=111878 RepID=A0AAV7KEC9_9METZ|nr:hypothetical protein LOD99_14611 [Oopsacas minuta]